MVKIGRGLNRCPQCQVPKELCYCKQMIQVDNKIPVTIIMHKRERFLTSNTAVVAKRALINSQIILRGMRNESASEQIIIKEGHIPLVLFPSDDALTIGSPELTSYLNGKPAHLIVPDGTWGQAKRVARREKALANVQAVKLANTGPSLYRLRRQVAEGRVCTFEAIARALGELESLQLEQKLMKVMAAMDHAHAMARGVDKFDDGNPDPLTERLFVGVRVGTLSPEIEQLKSMRPEFDWVESYNYHLTLAFIGRLRKSQKQNLMKELEKIMFQQFNLNFDQLDGFNSKENPAIIWLKPQFSQQLHQLAQQVRQIVINQGIPFENDGYIPHWTLARTRGHKLKANELSEWFSKRTSIEVNVKDVILFEGHARKGAYTEEAIYPLS